MRASVNESQTPIPRADVADRPAGNRVLESEIGHQSSGIRLSGIEVIGSRLSSTLPPLIPAPAFTGVNSSGNPGFYFGPGSPLSRGRAEETFSFTQTRTSDRAAAL